MMVKTEHLLIGAIALFLLTQRSSAQPDQEPSSGSGSVTGGYSTIPLFTEPQTATYTIANPIQPNDRTPSTTTYTTPQQTYKIEVISQQAVSKTTGQTWTENRVSSSSSSTIKSMAGAGIHGPVNISSNQFVYVPRPGTPAYNALSDPNTIIPVYTYNK